MNVFGLKLVVNIVTLSFLSFLLLGPVVFSQTISTYRSGSSLEVKLNQTSFGEYLDIEGKTREEQIQEFQIEYTAFFEKQALYRDILEVKNTSATLQTVKINTGSTEAKLYFGEDSKILETVKKLGPGESSLVSLLASESVSQNGEKREAVFILKTE